MTTEQSPLVKTNEKFPYQDESKDKLSNSKFLAAPLALAMIVGISYSISHLEPEASISMASRSQDSTRTIDVSQNSSMHTYNATGISVNATGPQANGTINNEDYFRCPPGAYLNDASIDKHAKNARIRDVIKKLKEKGWVVNKDEEYRSTYRTRGYATFESAIWPSPRECSTLPDETWTLKHNNDYYHYQPDHAPSIKKQRFEEYPFEFHVNWKVASTSFGKYLPSEYGSKSSVESYDPVPDGYLVASSVRNPLSRFVSGVEELLQRSVNNYCPSGYCNWNDSSTESYNNETLWKLAHQTSWFPLVCNSTKMEYNATGKRWESYPKCHYNGYNLPEVVTAFVEDDKCKYYFYGSQHFTSQSAFVTQNYGRAHTLDSLIKLENLTNGLTQLGLKMNHTANTSFPWLNSNSEKPGGLPTEDMIYEILDKIPSLTQDLCWIYAQDFICFEYDLPDACKGLF